VREAPAPCPIYQNVPTDTVPQQWFYIDWTTCRLDIGKKNPAIRNLDPLRVSRAPQRGPRTAPVAQGISRSRAVASRGWRALAGVYASSARLGISA
jgi:hypothetical protein